jgi:hypothetical protein
VVILGLGAPAWATTGQDGPTPPRLGDPVTAPRPEIQSVKILATSGTFTLTISGGACSGSGTTAPVAWDVSTTGLATAINAAITACGASGTVAVGGTPGVGYRVTFPLAIGNVNQMVESPDAAADVYTIQDYAAGFAAPGGGTVTTTVPPHGGYSSVTNYCLQCHAVHKADAATQFALMRQGSVTATCQTCHVLFGTGGTSPYDSNTALEVTGLTMGTAAARSAYDLGDGGLIGGGPIVRGHQIGGTGNAAVPGDYALDDGPITIYWAAYGTGYVQDANQPVSRKASGTNVDGGLYCGSCHTPHGEFGQLVNEWYMTTTVGTTTASAGATTITVTGANFTPADVKKTIRIVGAGAGDSELWTRIASRVSATTVTIVDPVVTAVTNATVYLGDEGREVWRRDPVAGVWLREFLDYDGETTVDAAVGWRRCGSAGAVVFGAGYGSACTAWAQVRDAEGQLVSLYGFQLLSSGPNHQFAPAKVKSYGTAYGGADSAEWCGTCHTQRWDDPNGTHANHPGACTRCHGNPIDQTSFDFPHTSTVARLLTQLPDGLCIRCHTNLP